MQCFSALRHILEDDYDAADDNAIEANVKFYLPVLEQKSKNY